ncbi:YdaS family helix-turn-helix protein [Stenotrophomonas sp. C3(2023)]|uniref:YdaS family helix-turn-helix protein n=1 Tax=Stenotrophomonas sp. C3(2023) TaxID=3080277 RepID=UPI00293D10BC|nr:YdaS family helix-turn-helix protein [Stenotrophomonas sp. C3(2023)]MDV3469039.1 YdaS family helix-turn-helix protein [Stenotrophomonas sp. C3(2023)]
MNAIAIAIEKYGTGQAGIARLLSVTPQAVNQWTSGSRPVPARHVLAIEAATGVSRHYLRPDVFGPAPANDDDHAEAA